MARAEENTPMGNVIRTMFPRESLRVLAGNCPFCGQAIDPSSFRDDLSRREFGISGLCQVCQDKTFGDE